MPPDFIAESELWGPLFALAVFVVLLLFAAILQCVFHFVLKRREKTSSESLDTELIATIRGPAILFIVILAPLLGFISLTELRTPAWDFANGLDIWARRMWTVVVVIEISYLASHVTQTLLAWYIRSIAARTDIGLESKLLPPVRRGLPSHPAESAG